jgi:signal transduction histidine kinase
MKETTAINEAILLSVIFFTVLATLIILSVCRYIAKSRSHTKTSKLFNKEVKQVRMELRDQIFKTIVMEGAGLITALEAEIRNIEKLGILQPVFRISGKPVMLEENKSVIIFRIVQEALHNVLKHAKATLVEMQVQFDCDNVKLTIKDNGKGIPGDADNTGRGLRNMRDRARLIGADFNLSSSASRGTLIMLIVPQRSEARF